MKEKNGHILFFFLLAFIGNGFSQSQITKTFPYTTDTIQFDTVSVFQSGFEVKVNLRILSPSEYYLNPLKAELQLKKNVEKGKITVKYERTPFNFNQKFKRKPRDIIVTDTTETIDPFIYSVSTANPNEDLFGSTKLNKQGSISRGVTVGNAQNLSLQSTLNLQLDGQIAPNLFLQGSISDDNVPFQPEGNTQKLQEFDQVYLKIYNDDFALIGGDFWLRKPKGYFLNYNKRTQGVSVENNHSLGLIGFDGKAEHKFSGAFSRGKFARNIIQGVEGNQGPYRLTGAENETFIVILAGTEKVYLDGELMTRGQEFDYTIDYNTAEITFTANNFITKDVRIIVEFQYSDLNYARSLFAYNGVFSGEKYDAWVNIYSEQDAKNQTIQQNLTAEKKLILTEAGDDLANAFANSIDSVGYLENRVLYKMVDSLGFDSVLVFTPNTDSAIYQAFFSQVPQGEGNYVFDRFTANGRVYKWVAPVDGIPQGNYAPVQLLIAPQKKRMYSFGTEYRFNEKVKSSVELAFSEQDINTFSNLDANDNKGVALKWNINANQQLGEEKNWSLKTAADFEFNERYFQPIQWFRSVEFDRDWNVRNQPYEGNQYLSKASAGLIGKDWGKLTYAIENFTWGTDYTGLRNKLAVDLQRNGWKLRGNASYLNSSGLENTTFIRHDTYLTKTVGWFQAGFKDIQETNKKRINTNPFLQLNSYRFYDWKTFVGTSDSTKNQLQLYYRERYDWFSDSTRLSEAAKARSVGLEGGLTQNPDHILKLNVSYRQLNIIDSTLYQGKPESTVLGRAEHIVKFWKGAISATSFYEVGSGLELRREFIYIPVNDGQGTHTWNDYNNDGIQDLGEFEIAAFADQGNYIRVFVPTNTYIRTYSNQLTSSIFLRPDRVWRSEKGIKKITAMFSDQVVYNVNRKTNYTENLQQFNPFVYNISDTSLVSISTSFRNTLWFNKNSPVFSINHTYQENGSKVLLTNGFDTRLNTFHLVQFRWNINKNFNLRTDNTVGRKKSESDYAPVRNYFIEYWETKPVFSYQPNTAFRIALNGKYSFKINQSDLNEEATIRDVGLDLRYNQVKKGSFNGRFNYINISYNASLNTSLAFEMLEGLKTGNNFTWGLTYQRKVAKNLQINFNYNGRKSEETNTIHSGGMELRAFF